MEKFSEPLHNIIKEHNVRFDPLELRIVERALGRLALYEETGMTPKEVSEMSIEWCVLKQAEAEGRLIILPAAKVFVLEWDAGENCNLACPASVDGEPWCTGCDHGKLFAYERKCEQSLLPLIGKTVFLTREEAENAIKKEEKRRGII